MRNFALFVVAGLVMGCATTTQLTSGADYVTSGRGAIDADIARVAKIEPQLRFPAKIGLAKVVNGQFEAMNASESELFAAQAEGFARFGSFVPISPLVVQMVKPQRRDRFEVTQDVVHDLRLAAARQHLDYLIVYEIGARSRERDTPFALADVTLIGGALLPTRSIKVAGIGQAIMVDVRNGYPYGTASVTEDLSGLGRSFGGGRREAALREKASARVASKLIPEVFAMLEDLAQQRP